MIAPEVAPNPALTRLLVVIPTLNEQAHIQSVLESVLADLARSPELVATVAVVDGGSTDRTCEIVQALREQHAGLQLLHNAARIQSAAVNSAVCRFGADADILIRCDAHAEYPADYCSRLVHTLRSVACDAVVVPMDSVGDTALQRAVAWLSNSPLGTGGSAHRGGTKSGFVDHGHHAAFRMSFFRSAGGYDERFSHNEDAELDCRQRALGARIYLDSEIRIRYRPRASLPSLWHQYFKYGAGRSRTARRHPGSLRLRQLAVPANLIIWLGSLILSAYSALFWCWTDLYLGAVLCCSFQLVLRQRSLAAFLAAPAAVTMHLAWATGFFSGLLRHRERIWQRDMAVPLQLATGGDA